MIYNLTENYSNYANTYLYVSGDSAMLIDASAAPEAVKNALTSYGATLKAIVLTHGHYDHIIYLKELLAAFPEAVLYCGKNENLVLTSPSANVSELFGNPTVYDACENELNDGDVLNIGAEAFKILSTPGHTIGSICLYNESESILFTGDTLFSGGIGRTDFEYGSYEMLRNSLSILSTLPENTKFYPGHGNDSLISWEF